MESFIDYVKAVMAAEKHFQGRRSRRFCSAVAALTASRLAKAAALILPIKILLMLSGDDLSSTYLRYIPLNPYVSLTILVLAIPGLYAASIVLASAFQHLVDFPPPPAQKKGAPLGYTATASSLSDFLLFAVALLICVLISPLFAAGFMVSSTVVVWFSSVLTSDPKKDRIGRLRILPSQALEYLGALAFLTNFLIIALLVVFADTSILIAVLCLMISRVALQSVQRVLKATIRSRGRIKKWAGY